MTPKSLQKLWSRAGEWEHGEGRTTQRSRYGAAISIAAGVPSVPSISFTKLPFVMDSSVVSLCSSLSQKHLPQWIEETLNTSHHGGSCS